MQRTGDQLTVQARCPAGLQEHLELRAARLSTYDLMTASQPWPSVTKPFKGDPKGKGKGKGKDKGKGGKAKGKGKESKGYGKRDARKDVKALDGKIADENWHEEDDYGAWGNWGQEAEPAQEPTNEV